MISKAILLAGGTGSRLWPLTHATSKQLMPVYNKPMIYFPLCTLMEAGFQDICIITTPADAGSFQQLLGDGEQWGISLTYRTQAVPGGIAQAFIVAADFVGDEPCALILGDNLFYGVDVTAKLRAARNRSEATVFAYTVAKPESYGVLRMGPNNEPLEIIEKPAQAPSSFAVTGLYCYPSGVLTESKKLKPSPRGELEITDLNNEYMRRGVMKVEFISRGCAWLDTGTPQDLLNAANFVQAIESRQGLMIACPEEVAYRQNWIGESEMVAAVKKYGNSEYGKALAFTFGITN